MRYPLGIPLILPRLQANRRHSRHKAGMKSRIHETVLLNLHTVPKPPLHPCEQKCLSITAKSVKARFAKFAHDPGIISPLRCGWSWISRQTESQDCGWVWNMDGVCNHRASKAKTCALPPPQDSTMTRRSASASTGPNETLRRRSMLRSSE